MEALTVQEILNASGGTLVSGSSEAVVNDIVIDSRLAKEGDMFVAVIGEVNDAHKFLPQVAESGCQTVMVSNQEEAEKYPAMNVILVEDTMTGIQRVAAYYLDKIQVRRLAVTGSVGKTSTRDMMYYICCQKYKTGRAFKNYNNQFGAPLAIFSLNSDMEVAVLEEGMEGMGEIHRLSWMIRPEIAAITNVGISHMERLGSRENIRKAKMEIVDYFGPENTLVINTDNDMLSREQAAGNYKLITVGTKGDEDYVISEVADNGEFVDFTVSHDGISYPAHLNVPGGHNALNAGLAIAVTNQFGIDIETAIKGLLDLELTGRRLKFLRGNGYTVIDDSYNAAPDSVRSAINTLAATKDGRRVAIIGNMNELGEGSEQRHYEIGAYAAEKGIELVVGIKEKAVDLVQGARDGGTEALWFASKEEMMEQLYDIIKPGDTVMIKASMTLHLGEIGDRLLEGSQK